MRSMGRNTSGVKGIRLGKGDTVVGMVVADPIWLTLLTVCELGYGNSALGLGQVKHLLRWRKLWVKDGQPTDAVEPAEVTGPRRSWGLVEAEIEAEAPNKIARLASTARSDVAAVV